MGKEQLFGFCPFSWKSEIIGVIDSVRHGRPLTKRLKGTTENLLSARNETQDPSAYSVWEYQEGIDRKGRPDLVHPHFGSMTDSLLRYVAIQKSSADQRMARFQLKQWRLLKEVFLELKDGEEIYALIPKAAEIEDGVALMKLTKEGGRFLSESQLLPENFNQETVTRLFEKLQEKGMEIKSLDGRESSLLFWVAQGGRETSIDLKEGLLPILSELSQPILAPSRLTSPSFSELVLSKEVFDYQPILGPIVEIVQKESVVFSAANLTTTPPRGEEKTLFSQIATSRLILPPDLPNFSRSLENGQPGFLEGNRLTKENQLVEKNEEGSVKKEPILDLELSDLKTKGVVQPAEPQETVAEIVSHDQFEGVNREEEEIVVFRATESLPSKIEPFFFNPKRPQGDEKKMLEIVLPLSCQFSRLDKREITLPTLTIPWMETPLIETFSAVLVEGSVSQEVDPPTLKEEERSSDNQSEIKLPPLDEVVTGIMMAEERPERLLEEGIMALSKPGSEISRTFPDRRFNFDFLKRKRRNQPEEVFLNLRQKFLNRNLRERRVLDWRERLFPKEMNRIAPTARDWFGIRQSLLSPAMIDLVIFWLLEMDLIISQPALYQLRPSGLPLMVFKKDGRLLVAKRGIRDDSLGIESLLTRRKELFSQPFLFLTI